MAQIAGVLEPSLREKINQSKILVVGAGGIGCEILKNLVMSGFSDIEIVRLYFHEICASKINVIRCYNCCYFPKFHLQQIFRSTWIQLMSAI